MFSPLYKVLSLSLKNSPEDWGFGTLEHGKDPYQASNRKLGVALKFPPSALAALLFCKGRYVADTDGTKILNWLEARLLYRQFYKVNHRRYKGSRFARRIRAEHLHKHIINKTMGIER